MNHFDSRGFIFVLAIVWVTGDGPYYEYDPYRYHYHTRSSLPATELRDPVDGALRAQNAQYRSIYRNKNYFVQSSHKGPTTTYAPPQVPRRTFGTTMTTASDTVSDSPILFESQSSTPANYIRTVETSSVSVVATTQVVTGVTGNTRTLYFPTPNGKVPPACAQNALYCEHYDTYPQDLLDEVLSRTFTPKEFQDVYGETVDNSTTTTDLKLLERTGLISSNYEETPLCSSVERTIYPRVARNKDNKWMYVVNHDEYIQGVRVEKCLDDDGASCVFGETAPAGYQTACRQKYIYKKLLALTPEGKTSTDTFKLPSCCVCFVKKVPLANRVLNTSPTAVLMTSRKPSAEENLENEPDYDDLPSTTSSTNSTTRSKGGSVRARH